MIPGRFVKATLIILGIHTFSCLGHATKPCAPSPCLDENHRFDEVACRAASDWIAIGEISNIVHKHEGPPTNKDFARFELRVRKWEKGEKNRRNKLYFQVGWCENQQELPADISGLFRFYGPDQPAPIAGGAQYFYFEPLKT